MVLAFLNPEEVTSMNVTIVGIDLAKNVFQVHGTDERSKTGLKKPLKRSQVPDLACAFVARK